MPDWPIQHQVCGFLDVPAREDAHGLPEELERFLQAGPPPVFMTFGSMLLGDVEFVQVTRLLEQAACTAGCRAIVQAPWPEIPSTPCPSNVYRVYQVPHGALFPRCAAVVHHGGAGTTHSATLAGCPSIPVAYAYDQVYWGKCLQAAGAAPAPLRRRTLRAQSLAHKIREVLAAPELKVRADALGSAMRQERGVERAVALIEQASANATRYPMGSPAAA